MVSKIIIITGTNLFLLYEFIWEVNCINCKLKYIHKHINIYIYIYIYCCNLASIVIMRVAVSVPAGMHISLGWVVVRVVGRSDVELLSGYEPIALDAPVV